MKKYFTLLATALLAIFGSLPNPAAANNTLPDLNLDKPAQQSDLAAAAASFALPAAVPATESLSLMAQARESVQNAFWLGRIFKALTRLVVGTVGLPFFKRIGSWVWDRVINRKANQFYQNYSYDQNTRNSVDHILDEWENRCAGPEHAKNCGICGPVHCELTRSANVNDQQTCQRW